MTKQEELYMISIGIPADLILELKESENDEANRE